MQLVQPSSMLVGPGANVTKVSIAFSNTIIIICGVTEAIRLSSTLASAGAIISQMHCFLRVSISQTIKSFFLVVSFILLVSHACIQSNHFDHVS